MNSTPRGAALRRVACLVLLGGVALAGGPPRAGAAEPESPGYRDYREFTAALDVTVARGGAAARKVSLGRTRGGREIWAVALGRDARRLAPHSGRVAEIAGDPAGGPALLLVAGLDAAQLSGSEEALRILNRMAADYGHVDSVTRMLEATTLYLIPRASPDACERYFERPQFEALTNRTPADDDRDGAVDEDAPEDLNADGLITTMRVEDPEGDWIVNPEEPRLMRRADRLKGEVGRYKLYLEGLDNDQDERWNEDGVGGVDFSLNWPMGYRYFSPGAGVDPMTEIENRAVADFLYDHAAIAAVLTLGAQDNLLHPWKADPGSGRASTRALASLAREGAGGGDFGNYGGGTAGVRISAAGGGGPGGGGGPEADPRISAPPAEDAQVYDQFSERYRKLTSFKDSPEPPAAEGDLATFVYYDFGRWSLSARPWWPLAQGAPDSSARAAQPAASAGGDTTSRADSAGARSAERLGAGGEGPRGPRARGGDGGPSGVSRPGGVDADAEADRKALKALDSLHVKAIVPWTAVSQPDFPGRKVEVGGWRPYARTVAPVGDLDSLSRRLADFTGDLLRRLPRLELREAKATKLGPGLYRVEAGVVNAGLLPTRSQMGRIARWPGSTFANLRLPVGAAVVSGRDRARVGAVSGSEGLQRVSWIVRAPGGGRAGITLEGAGSAQAAVEVSLP